jgi:hypothetical protein
VRIAAGWKPGAATMKPDPTGSKVCLLFEVVESPYVVVNSHVGGMHALLNQQ